MHLYMYVRTTCTYKHHIHVYTQRHTHSFIHTQTHTVSHTHVHTHTHTHTQNHKSVNNTVGRSIYVVKELGKATPVYMHSESTSIHVHAIATCLPAFQHVPHAAKGEKPGLHMQHGTYRLRASRSTTISESDTTVIHVHVTAPATTPPTMMPTMTREFT